MSVLKTIQEYTQMVRDGIKNRDEIISALMVSAQVKNGTASEKALAEILRRKDICAACPHNSDNAKKTGYTSSLPFRHCVLCKCRIGYDDGKEYCLECNCGISELNKANEKRGIKPIPLKWEAFKKTEN